MTIFRQASFRTDFQVAGQMFRAGKPEDEVYVMAAFGYEYRGRFLFSGPESAHKSMCHPVDADIDTMVDPGNLPEFAAPGDFSDSGEVWVIAHHVAHGRDGILPLCKCHQFPALADIFGHRLFQQQVEPGFKYLS